MSDDFYAWHNANTDNKHDLARELRGPDSRWAVIGPDWPKGWGWTVVDGASGDDLGSGKADDEAGAKAFVDAWEREHCTPVVLVTNFELLRALDGHDQVFATSDGGQVRLRLYNVDELLTAQREAAASLPGPDPGMTREAAIDLCRPVSLRELAQRLRNQ